MDIPIEVTTDSNSSTQAQAPIAKEVYPPEQVVLTPQPIPNPTPTKPSMTIGNRIVFFFSRIFRIRK